MTNENKREEKTERVLSTQEVRKLLKKRSKSELVKTCIELADRIDELKEENEKLKGEMHERDN